MQDFEKILFSAFKICTDIIPLVMFCWPLQHRKRFIVRISLAVAAFIGMEILSMALPLDKVSGDLFIVHSLYNVGIFLIDTVLMLMCFKDNYFPVLFCCLAGKCTMHLAEYINSLISTLYGAPNTFLSMVVYAIVYVAVYFIFTKRIKSEDCTKLSNIKVIVCAFIVITVTDTIFMAFGEFRVIDNIKVFVYLLAIIICFVLLCLQFGLLNESKFKRETEIINQLRVKEEEQFEISQETIKLIGIKHHDIKNMLESNRAKFSDEEIDAITKSIDAYDFALRTGNSTLDVILTEKIILCRRLNIKMEYSADGSSLDFMSSTDIYSLFLNALNNAIEHTQKIEDEAKRRIWVKVYLTANILSINVRNYCIGELVFTNKNMISTTKEDKRYHGFGLQSMNMIAEKYGGKMSITTENGMFSLGFAIPVA